MREVILAIGAFIGGRSINALGQAHKDGRQLRDSVTRLAIGVESISGDLQSIRGEIREQVGDLKLEIHEQVSGLKVELHQQQLNHDQRMAGIEYRVDGVNQRIDALAASDEILINRAARSTNRLAWERGCPPQPPEDDGKP